MLRTTARTALFLIFAVPMGAASPSTDVYGEAARVARTPSSSATSVAIIAEAQRRADRSQRRADDRDQSNDEWCEQNRRNNDNDRETFCEVREFTISSGSIDAETSNGSIRVTGEQRRDIFVRAMIMATGRTEADARDIAKQVTVSTSGRIRATGPRTSGREGWWVGFRIQTPESANVELSSSNGSLSVSDVRGRMKLRTSNGSISLMEVGGDVTADTSNGSITATLAGSKWDGAGLDLSTSNGSVRLNIPDGYNAQLSAGTSNGSINVGFPITMTGRINRDIDTTLGSGGAPIRVRTSNGSVTLQRR